MAEFEEAEIERNLREFVLARTAEPVYLELREGLIIIRHVSRYGSSILATFWTKKLYDTRGLWKVVLQVEDVIITIFTKTGTITFKGIYALEWFINRFQRILNGYESSVQGSQSLSRIHTSIASDKPGRASSRNLRRDLDVCSEQRLSSRLSTGRTTSKRREIAKEPSPRTGSEHNQVTAQGNSKTQEVVSETEHIDNASEAERTDQSSSATKTSEETVKGIDEGPCPQAQASPSADDPTEACSNDEHVVNDLVDLSDGPKPSATTEASSGTSSSSGDENGQDSADVSCLIQKAKNVVFDLIDDDESFPADVKVTNGCDIVNEGERYRQEWLQLNETLKIQDLDLWVGDELGVELQALTTGCGREGSTYVYPLWRSLLHKFMSTQDCKIYMASPYMDKPRLLDICLALLRNRLTACVDTVCVQRHCNSAQLISDLKRSVVRDFTTTDQVLIEYKLYSSFVYPFRRFHYSFLAGVKNAVAEVMVTTADFHADHFDSDTLDFVTYQKMSEDEFRIRYLGPLTLRNDIPSI
ncbi:uncharacterized protein LOC135468686 isoform X2 [Liolophura sinensis]|uniref:uncharacterized protein LOC135468686 isoform X2 n=1 Tax=Liolophura sinensis TaxID=3198878 RepID=UPI0031583664